MATTAQAGHEPGRMYVDNDGDIHLNGAQLINTSTPVVVKTDDYTLTAADSGKTFISQGVSKTFTLPSTAAGLTYTIIAGVASQASGNGVSISPQSADGLSGGVINKDIINTQATAIIGDFCTVVGSGTAGTTAWACSKGGIWAAEG